MECFVIFVMTWCWFNATESKPHNVSGQAKRRHDNDKNINNNGNNNDNSKLVWLFRTDKEKR